ncbi:hypothetical protein CN481_15685 [Bacillus sp. AFS006103]|nr:hypothetical protein CN481_15685 [Bacillus sp. AFS006103]
MLNKEITLETLDQLSNSEVINTLTSVKGIGVWTAEMFLVFSQSREDVLSILDVGLQRGAKWLYSTEDGKKALIEKGAKMGTISFTCVPLSMGGCQPWVGNKLPDLR